MNPSLPLSPQEIAAAKEKGISYLTLDQFPHWDELSQTGTLPKPLADERRAVMEEMLDITDEEPLGIGIELDRTGWLHDQKKWQAYFFSPPDMLPSLSLSAKNHYQWKDNTCADPLEMDSGKRFVYPYPSLKKKLPDRLVQNTRSIICLRPWGEPDRRVWATFLFIPESYVIHAPPVEPLLDYARKHEERHHEQLILNNKDKANRFHMELDADYYGIDGNSELQKTIAQMRFMQIFKTKDFYWNGQYLAPQSPDRRAPYLDQARNAVLAIRDALKQATQVFYPVDATLVYDPKRPEITFSALRLLRDNGTFDKTRHTLYIADQVLESCETFSPGISRERLSKRTIYDMGQLSITIQG